MSDYVKSINYDQHQIIKDILKLHCTTDIELDATYSTGNFYKKGIKEPKHKFDIDPRKEGVVQADARNLPIESESISTIMYDPPFLSTRGKSLADGAKKESNKTVRRFGWYPTEKELFDFYKDSLKEAYRILKKGGILIVKLQDKVSSGKQYMSHVYVINMAEKLGFYTKDLFVLLAKNRMTPQWQIDNQRHSRKYHSYFLVFQKKIVDLGIDK